MMRNLLWFAGLCAALALLYVTGLSRNIFYLMFSFCCGGLAIVLMQNVKVRGTVLAILFIAAMIGVSAPLPKRVDVQKGYVWGQKEMPAGEAISFRYELTDLDRRRAECGALKGEAIFTGTNVATIDVSVNAAPEKNVKIEPIYDRQIVFVPLAADVKSPVTVTLTPREKYTLYQGPEVSGRDVYPDAVYLRFSNDKCYVIYHAHLFRS